MPPQLEIVEGPAKGRKIDLEIGRTVSVGRSSAKSMVAIPEDEHMSAQHFTAGVRSGTILLNNLSNVNPIEVAGQRVNSHVLQPGETFKAGLNVFSFVVPPPNPHQPKISIGGWGFESIPEGWEKVEGSGFRHTVTEPFRANILLLEEPLPKDYTLKKYVELQIDLGKKYLSRASFKDPVETKVAGAEAAIALSLSAFTKGKGLAVQHQVYAAHSGIVGVLTATALESQASMLHDVLSIVFKGLSFFQS